jgi:hypothetical protein
MDREKNFPPKGTTTRTVFVGAIVALSVALLLAGVFGPMFTVGEADPRPWVAVLSTVTYLVMFAVAGWLVWMVARRRRSP